MPVVSDAAGNLYNKDAVLQFLLPGDQGEEISNKPDCEEIMGGRVKSIRDVVEVKFELENNGEEKSEEKKDAKWICPVSHKELGPSVKSVYLVPCGHAFAEGAIREMKSDKCLQCNEPYESDSVVPILPVHDSEKERLRRRTQDLAERGLAHSLKKAPGSKKRKKNGVRETGPVDDNKAKNDSATPRPGPLASASASGAASRTATPVAGPNSGGTESRTSTPAAQSGLKNPATATLAARVLDEENERNKRRRVVGTNETYKTLFTSDSKNEKDKNGDFMNRGFSIPSSARR